MNVATSEPVSVGVRELKNGLSRYLDMVALGYEVIVTERGRPVARLSPVDVPTSRLAELIMAGIVSAPSGLPRKRLPARVRATPGPPISDLVAEQRR